VFPINEKETRCCHILFAKCPVFKGLLPAAYAKLFMNDPSVEIVLLVFLRSVTK